MRSVPHRVVCLVGLDDGVFPRAGTVDGDDVLGRRPLTGERDARSEDRQLLLDALLAATEHVVITYTGANEQSGAPPATRRTARRAARRRRPHHRRAGPGRDPDPAPAAALRRPQPQGRRPGRDPPEWTDPELRGPAQRPFSFDTAALAGARSAWGVRHEPPPLLERTAARAPARGRLARRPQGLPAAPGAVVPARPARRRRRRSSPTSSPTRSRSTSNSLEVWQVGDHLLREVLAGQDPVAVMTAEQLRGTLPPAVLGELALTGRRRGVPAAVGPHRRAAGGRAALGRRRRRPRRRPPADRHRARRLRHPGASRSATPGSSPSSGCRPGSTCSR